MAVSSQCYFDTVLVMAQACTLDAGLHGKHLQTTFNLAFTCLF